MSLVSQGRGVSGGTLGGLGVVGSRCLGGSGSPFWISDPFPIATPSLSCSDPPSQLQPQFHQRAGVVRCSVCLSGKGGHRDRPPSPGFYSRLFVTPKVTGGWRPVIDLSRLNGWVELSSFRMETAQSVLRSLRPGDWMVSLDLQDAYLQVPVHPASRRYLRFCVGDAVFQFRACSSAFPQPLRCSPASWLLFCPSCVTAIFVFSVIWMTG